MIEELTAEQEQDLVLHQEEWTKNGLSVKSIDKKVAKIAVENLYITNNKNKPCVMFFDSPLQCILAINILKKYGRANLRDSLEDSLGANLRANLRDSLEDSLGANLRANLRANLKANLRDSLWANLWVNLRDNLRDNIRGNYQYIDTWFWAGLDSYWLSFYDFGEKIGVKYSKKQQFDAYKEFSRTCGISYFYKDIAFVSNRPEIINKNNDGMMHCENGAALKFRDGYSVYCWNGINISQKWIEDRDNLTPQVVLQTENVEQRVVGCAIIGWDKIADLLDQKIIDGNPNSDIGALVEFQIPDLPETGRFLRAKCPRNGTICEGVPKVSNIDNLEINTAIAAQAWRDGFSQNEYQHPPVRT